MGGKLISYIIEMNMRLLLSSSRWR